MNEEDKQRLEQIGDKLSHVPLGDPETSIYYVFYKEDVRWLLEKMHDLCTDLELRGVLESELKRPVS